MVVCEKPSLPDAKRVGEYRRGSKAARVFSMNFNTEGTLLCVSSDTETVHVYNLVEPIHGAPHRKRGEQDAEQTGIHPHSPPASEAPSSPTLSMSNNTAQPNRSQQQQQQQQPPTTTASASFSRRSLHLGKNLVAGMGGYMPKGVTEMWEPRRDFASLKLRGGGGIRSVVAMSP